MPDLSGLWTSAFRATVIIVRWPYRFCFNLVRLWWSDIRSYGISAVVGFLVGTLTIAYGAGLPKQFKVIPPLNGGAQPMPGLLAHLEKSSVKVDFEPAQLREVWVCEYAHLRGSTGPDLFFEYIAKYPECFSLRRADEEHYVVERSSRREGGLTEVGDQLFCKCANVGSSVGGS